MGNFQYEWWKVQAKELGIVLWLEVKAKNKENAIKQIQEMSNGEIYWETLVLDRKSYQRIF